MGRMNTYGVKSGNCDNRSGREKKPKSGSQRERKETCSKSAERKDGILPEKGKMVDITVTDREHRNRPFDASVVGQALVDPHGNGKERTVEKRVTRTRPNQGARTLGGHPIRSNHCPDMDITRYAPMCAIGVSTFNRTVQNNKKSRNTKGAIARDTVSRGYWRTSDIEESTRSARFFLRQDESFEDLYELEEKRGELKENNLCGLLKTGKYKHLAVSNQSARPKRVRSAKTKPPSSAPVTPIKAKNGCNPRLAIATKYGNNESKLRETPGNWSKRQKERLLVAERKGKLRGLGAGTNNEIKTDDPTKDKPTVGSVNGKHRKYTITLSLPTVDISEESESSISSCGRIEMSLSSSSAIASELAFGAESGTSNDLLYRLRSSSISAIDISAKSSPKPIDLANPYQGVENENPEIEFRTRFCEPAKKNEGQDSTTTNPCDKTKPASQSSVFKGIIEMLAPRTQRKKKTNFNAHCNRTSYISKPNNTNRTSVPKPCVKSITKSKPKSIQQLVHEARGTKPSELDDNTRMKIPDKSHETRNRQVCGKKRELHGRKQTGLRIRELSKKTVNRSQPFR